MLVQHKVKSGKRSDSKGLSSADFLCKPQSPSSKTRNVFRSPTVHRDTGGQAAHRQHTPSASIRVHPPTPPILASAPSAVYHRNEAELTTPLTPQNYTRSTMRSPASMNSQKVGHACSSQLSCNHGQVVEEHVMRSPLGSPRHARLEQVTLAAACSVQSRSPSKQILEEQVTRSPRVPVQEDQATQKISCHVPSRVSYNQVMGMQRSWSSINEFRMPQPHGQRQPQQPQQQPQSQPTKKVSKGPSGCQEGTSTPSTLLAAAQMPTWGGVNGQGIMPTRFGGGYPSPSAVSPMGLMLQRTYQVHSSISKSPKRGMASPTFGAPPADSAMRMQSPAFGAPAADSACSSGRNERSQSPLAHYHRGAPHQVPSPFCTSSTPDKPSKLRLVAANVLDVDDRRKLKMVPISAEAVEVLTHPVDDPEAPQRAFLEDEGLTATGSCTSEFSDAVYKYKTTSLDIVHSLIDNTFQASESQVPEAILLDTVKSPAETESHPRGARLLWCVAEKCEGFPSAEQKSQTAAQGSSGIAGNQRPPFVEATDAFCNSPMTFSDEKINDCKNFSPDKGARTRVDYLQPPTSSKLISSSSSVNVEVKSQFLFPGTRTAERRSPSSIRLDDSFCLVDGHGPFQPANCKSSVGSSQGLSSPSSGELAEEPELRSSKLPDGIVHGAESPIWNNISCVANIEGNRTESASGDAGRQDDTSKVDGNHDNGPESFEDLLVTLGYVVSTDVEKSDVPLIVPTDGRRDVAQAASEESANSTGTGVSALPLANALGSLQASVDGPSEVESALTAGDTFKRLQTSIGQGENALRSLQSLAGGSMLPSALKTLQARISEGRELLETQTSLDCKEDGPTTPADARSKLRTLLKVLKTKTRQIESFQARSPQATVFQSESAATPAHALGSLQISVNGRGESTTKPAEYELFASPQTSGSQRESIAQPADALRSSQTSADGHAESIATPADALGSVNGHATRMKLPANASGSMQKSLDGDAESTQMFWGVCRKWPADALGSSQSLADRHAESVGSPQRSVDGHSESTKLPADALGSPKGSVDGCCESNTVTETSAIASESPQTSVDGQAESTATPADALGSSQTSVDDHGENTTTPADALGSSQISVDGHDEDNKTLGDNLFLEAIAAAAEAGAAAVAATAAAVDGQGESSAISADALQISKVNVADQNKAFAMPTDASGNIRSLIDGQGARIKMCADGVRSLETKAHCHVESTAMPAVALGSPKSSTSKLLSLKRGFQEEEGPASPSLQEVLLHQANKMEALCAGPPSPSSSRCPASPSSHMSGSATCLITHEIQQIARDTALQTEGGLTNEVQQIAAEPDLNTESGDMDNRALLLRLPNVKRTSGLTLETGAFYKPKDGAGEGEDSYFIELPALGVADGVGGCKQHFGYTSKAFADELMQSCTDQVVRAESPRENYPQKLLEAAEKMLGRLGKKRSSSASAIKVQETPARNFNRRHRSPSYGAVRSRSKASPSQVAKNILCKAFGEVKSFGAATALISFFDFASNHLGVASLGDSGLMVIRRSTQEHWEYMSDTPLRESDSDPNSQGGLSIVFQSPSQQHSFNVPYQVAKFPKEMLSELTSNLDSPEDALTFDVEIQEGDLILLYSDGVTDNLSNSEILHLCDRFSPYAVYALGLSDDQVTNSQMIAESVVVAAYKKSIDTAARTPFTEEALLADWPLEACIGGKVDDITCVAAWVTYRQDELRSRVFTD